MTARADNSTPKTNNAEFAFNDLEPGQREDLSPASKQTLQSNILSSTRAIRSKQVFLRFDDTPSIRAWLKQRAPEATDARHAQSEHTNLFFTASGLRKLGVPQTTLNAMDAAFCRGALSPDTLFKLRDNPQDWGPHAKEWDVVVVCNTMHGALDDELPAFAQSEDCKLEHGKSLGADRLPLDSLQEARFGHFGYRDGISNPVYTQRAYEEVANDHTLSLYDPRRPMSSLLVRDPLCGARMAFGSYLVFRKYRQDVTAFEQRIEQIATQIVERRKAVGRRAPDDLAGMEGMGQVGPVALGDRFPQFLAFEAGADPEGLRALIRQWVMGRSLEGEVATELKQGAGLNSFDYVSDPNGRSCPFHAHIRKMNPRGLTGNAQFEARAAFARRGISYINPSDEHDRGLLFWCAQADITAQFEYIQQKWANADGADLRLRPTPDADALIGRLDERPFERPTNPYPPNTTRYERWKSTIDIDFNVWDTVHLQGSSYVFAPSLMGIKQLKSLS